MAGKGKRKKGVIIVGSVLLLLVIAAVVIFYLYTKQSHYVSDKDAVLYENVYEKAAESETQQDADDHSDENHEEPTDSETKAQAITYDITGITMADQAEYRDCETLLAIGYHDWDDQDREGYGTADAIILVTFNPSMKVAYFYAYPKNMHVEIPEFGPGTLEAAFDIGGGTLLSKTMEQNYGIAISHYAAIKLKDVAELLEIPEFNRIDTGRDGVDMIEKLVHNLKLNDPADIVTKLKEMLSLVTHNVTEMQMIGLLLKVPAYVSYVSEKHVLPEEEDTYSLIDGVIVPDVYEMSRRIKENIYQKAEPVEREGVEETDNGST